MIYLDHAATSYPKPAGVGERMKYYVDQVGANAGRASYASAREAGRTVLRLRQRLCGLFAFPHLDHVILTAGATAGLNLILKGLLQPGDHCIVSAMEHNAVMRPLVQLERRGITFDRAPCDWTGRLRLEALSAQFRPNTKLVVLAHASNVCGVLQDALAVGALCRARGVPFVLDAAQSAGHVPIDAQALNLSALVVPGHKGLLGPQGIGAALIVPELAVRLDPLTAGGTGSASDSEELPPCFPAGARNPQPAGHLRLGSRAGLYRGAGRCGFDGPRTGAHRPVFGRSAPRRPPAGGPCRNRGESGGVLPGLHRTGQRRGRILAGAGAGDSDPLRAPLRPLRP